jgi:hypothetical protein
MKNESLLLEITGVDTCEIVVRFEFLAQMFDEVGDASALVHLHVVRERSGNKILVDGDQAGEGHGGKAEGTHGFVDLGHVFGTDAAIVSELHIGFDVLDQFIEVKELGAFERSGVFETITIDVETVFEGVEVARLTSAFAYRGRRRFGKGGLDYFSFDAAEFEGFFIVALRVGEDGLEVGEEFFAGRLTCGTQGERFNGIGLKQRTCNEKVAAERAQLVVGERGAGVGILGGRVDGRDGGFGHGDSLKGKDVI